MNMSVYWMTLVFVLSSFLDSGNVMACIATDKKGGMSRELLFIFFILFREALRMTYAGLQSAVGSTSDCRSRGRKFEFQLGHIFFENNEIISTPSADSRRAVYRYLRRNGYCFKDQVQPVKVQSVSRLTGRLDMILTVLTGPKTQFQTKKWFLQHLFP